MRVLVLGATGSIGTAVSAELQAAGHDVLALARSEESAARLKALGYGTLKGDLRHPGVWSARVREVDAVVHAAATFTDDMGAVDRAVLESIRRQAADAPAPLRVVYTGGVWLYGATGDAVATEQTPFAPIQSFAWMVENARMLLSAPELSAAVLHPAMVYHSDGGVFASFMDDLAAGRPVEVWGSRHVRWPLIHRRDLAVAYRLMVERGDLVGHFNASAEAGVCVQSIAAFLAERAGRPLTLIERPVADVVEENGAWAEGPTLDQQMSSAKLQNATGWRPRLTDFRQAAYRCRTPVQEH